MNPERFITNRDLANNLKKDIKEFGDPTGSLAKIVERLMEDPDRISYTREQLLNRWSKKLRKGMKSGEIKQFFKELDDSIK